ncbi:GerAB/ArcD/ProY family transporter [Desulforamulus ruminis]|uniref:Spore germination protein n=1 Tax=Desulforamulus ruminis (strain ATCC 23193 / DSM 2154 / NCIMB 8452 / DL) TaxID=696281 RepID=F6DMD0_DESRL|nr:endospore germination permease [Desulforamulus ruminis]AEG60597.1 spore germination protein [Desulforamulus ruminis DSM 2154]
MAKDVDAAMISNRQFTFILILFITSTADVFLPSISVQLAGRDTWLAVMVAAFIASGIVLIQAELAQRFPGQPPSAYAGKLLGPLGGALFIFCYLFFLFYLTAVVIGELVQITNSIFFSNTPNILIVLLLTLAAGYAALLGLEVVARVIEFVFPLGLLIRILIVAFALSDLEMIRFMPVLEHGVGPVLQSSMRITAWLGEGVILLFLAQFIKSPAAYKKSMLAAIWTVAFLLLLSSLSVGLFGSQQAADITFSLFEIIRILEFGGSRGFEAILMVFWYSATFFKVSILMIILFTTLQKITRAEATRTLLLPLILLVTILPLFLSSEVSKTLLILKNTWPGLALTFELLLPALLLMIGLLKKKNNRGGSQNES